MLSRLITLDDILAARPVAMRSAIRSPLVRLGDGDTWLKLECLQPGGSFKIRGARAQIEALAPKAVLTASAGNMAAATALCARDRGIPCHVVVPDTAPRAKTDQVERLGGRIVRVPFDRWWKTFEDRAYPGIVATYMSAFDHPAMLAGNGTIGLEILEDLPDVETVLVPWGGGGLSCGIAVAIKARAPHVKVIAVEVDTAAPLTASWAAGEPRAVEYKRTFVDGLGAKTVFPHMYELGRRLLDGVLTASLDEVRDAVRRLAVDAHVIAEGAGAVPVAVARRLKGRVACVVSGGNIDASVLAEILR